ANIKVILSVEDAGEAVSAADKNLITEQMGSTYQLGQYLDINLFKVIDNDRSQIRETNGKVRIIIMVPENLKNKNPNVTRTFSVIRVHNGAAAILNDLSSDGNEIVIETDRFSTYAIVYKDSVSGQGGGSGSDNKPGSTDSGNGNSNEDTDEDEAPVYTSVKTGDDTPIAMYIIMIMIAGSCLVLMMISGRFNVKRNRKEQ
ncbi:MAG: hypothetical protein NC086_00290, partial [Alistipes sp.]|nr:hypothetical protein [Alistipes sp.]